MPRTFRFIFTPDDDDEGADRQTLSLAGLAIALLIVVAGLFLIHTLHASAAVEDCLMSGRRNCDAVVAPIHWPGR